VSTFVYAPGVRIFIKTEKNGTIDVSEDLVDYTVQRRSDGPSTLNFSIQNIQRKYDQVFSPNDEVIVELKRIKWVRVFTGLLNSVPLITMWPRVVAFSASCSLKRLQYWYWDPQLASAFSDAIIASGAGKGTSDTGITNMILTLLKEVVGWDPTKAHIGAIPANWFRLALPYAQQLADQLVSADAQVTAMMSSYGTGAVGGATVDGSTTGNGVPTTTSATGLFSTSFTLSNGEVLKPARMANAEIIIRVGESMVGINYRDIIGAIATAIQESRLNELSANSQGYVGLFQQHSGWGGLDPALRTNPQETSKTYFQRLLDYFPDRASLSLSVQMGKVEGYVNAQQHALHDRFIADATKMVNTYNSSVTNVGSVANDPNSKAAGTAVTNAQATTVGGIKMAGDLVSMGLSLLAKYPHIPYGTTSTSQTNQTAHAPNVLGCSAFISWVLYNLFGSLPSGWSFQWAEGQYQWCLSNGGKELPLDEALKTQGALLIRHPIKGVNGGEGHIEITVGDGVQSMGATHPGEYASVHKAYLNQFHTAILMPSPSQSKWGFDYSQAKSGKLPPSVYVGSTGGVASTSAATVPYSQTTGFDSTNVFDQMFGGLLAPAPGIDQQQEHDMALAFAGPRALLNDQPLLPYLKNLVNASMRSFCSAPNGDFMAWFPDYYGLWGTAAIMVLEPIEMQDFYVEWTDDYFVTHQYTVAGTLNYLDTTSGAVQTTFTPQGSTSATPFEDARLVTAGIASIDIPAIMYALFGISLTNAEGEQFRKYIYRKFGARPDFKEMDGMVGKTAELFSAMYYFMRQWAYQYNANIPLTFMPELWPGMLIQVPEYNFQAYVTAVTHSGQMGEGGGHETSVNIAAPARMPDGTNTHHLIGLPLASGMLQANANVNNKVSSGASNATRGGQRPGGGD
jgi:hypothetical protein